MSTGLPDSLPAAPTAQPTEPLPPQSSALLSDEPAPRLLADVGGTNARFALQRGAPGARRIGDIRVYACSDFAGLADVLHRYLSDTVGAGAIRHAAIAIANPIDGDQVRMTNHAWHFSIDETRRALGFETFIVVNDFAALAMAVPALGPGALRQTGGGQARAGSVIGIVGPGTGLGVSALVPGGTAPDGSVRWLAVASEGGHAGFAPVDERDDRVLHYARRRYRHVSFERVASGPGIELIHQALHGAADSAGASPGLPGDVASIVQQAQGGDARALETVEVFCGILGSFAGNVALTFGAHGGIYIGGGVVPRLGRLFYASPFRQRFEAKGRFEQYLAALPTFIIVDEYPAFVGAAALLDQALSR